MHVCYISQEYPPETGWGGVGAYTYEMAHALAEAGHGVTVISRAGDGTESVSSERGVEVHRILPRPSWNLPLFWRMNRIWPGFAWAAMQRLRSIHNEKPIDLVEAAEVRADGFFVAFMPRAPKLVTRLHTAQIFVDRLNRTRPRHSRWKYWLEKKSILRANVLTAPTNAVIELTRSWLRLQDQKTLVIPNPVNEQQFRPSASPRKNIIVYTGRLERRKGIHVIAGAIPLVLKEFPEAEFLFVGADGPDHDGVSWKDKLVSAAPAEYREQLRFEQRSRDALVGAYQEAAVCILPSVWENFPYAMLEAMSCGAPVIASETGGFPELIENSVSGFLVPVNDAHALAARIVQLLNSPALGQSIGDNARRRVETCFSPRQVLPTMIAAYEHALAS